MSGTTAPTHRKEDDSDHTIICPRCCCRVCGDLAKWSSSGTGVRTEPKLTKQKAFGKKRMALAARPATALIGPALGAMAADVATLSPSVSVLSSSSSASFALLCLPFSRHICCVPPLFWRLPVLLFFSTFASSSPASFLLVFPLPPLVLSACCLACVSFFLFVLLLFLELLFFLSALPSKAIGARAPE